LQTWISILSDGVNLGKGYGRTRRVTQPPVVVLF
jgi:hypothetical protein